MSDPGITASRTKPAGLQHPKKVLQRPAGGASQRDSGRSFRHPSPSYLTCPLHVVIVSIGTFPPGKHTPPFVPTFPPPVNILFVMGEYKHGAPHANGAEGKSQDGSRRQIVIPRLEKSGRARLLFGAICIGDIWLTEDTDEHDVFTETPVRYRSVKGNVSR